MTVHVRSVSRLVLGLAALALAAVVLAPRAEAQERTLRVPQDFDTIQAAVDASTAGDVVLVDAGEYHEEVFVGPEHAGITIRGVDRNRTVLDGRNELSTAIEVNGADDVTIENMTAHDYDGNGFYWQSVDGFLGRYLTAYRIGIYAIFSFDSANGVFEDSYASGSADAAYYVGQCNPCNIVLRRLVAEYSALGYSGTNAGGNLVLEDSLWQNNGTGILPNSLTSEEDPPQRQAVIRNNVVKDNSNAETPAHNLAGSLIGVGIGIAGGNENVVEGNTVTGHDKYGIAIFPLPEPDPIWHPKNNTVRNNTVEDSGLADLTITALSGEGNCFEGNTFATSDPPGIEEDGAWGCGGTGLKDVPFPPGNGSPTSASALASDLAQNEADLRERPSYETMPDAPQQQSLPAAAGDDGATEAAPSTPPTPQPASSSLPTTGGGLAALVAGLSLLGSAVRFRRR